MIHCSTFVEQAATFIDQFMLNCMSVLKLNLHLRIYVMLLKGKLQNKFPVNQNNIIIKKTMGSFRNAVLN